MRGRQDDRPVTTLRFPRRSAWTGATRPMSVSPVALVRAVPFGGVAVLNGSDRRNQLGAAVLRRLRPDVHLVLADCTWKRGSSKGDRIASRLLVRVIAGPRTTFCVLTDAEAQRFPSTWGVPSDRVVVTRWYHGLTEEELEAPVDEAGYVFAGGDSLRDYGPLLEAARGLPVRVRVASRKPPPVPVAAVPDNVNYGPLPEGDYRAVLRSASVVVVPLAGGTERSAGQNNYLNPMALGKVVVVTDATGVREHVTHGVHAMVVPPGDALGLRAALLWTADPANADALTRMRAAARAHVRRAYGPDTYVARLLEVARQAAG